ncbi:MAG: hypothetical protein WB764_06205, partial [Xanthobacteraceae bacterium]
STFSVTPYPNLHLQYTPFVVEPDNQPQTGTLRPHYKILTLVYAPPAQMAARPLRLFNTAPAAAPAQ